MYYLFAFSLTFLVTIPIVAVIQRIALKMRIVDDPRKAPDRKIHSHPVPLLGGIVIFLAFFLISGYYILGTDKIIFAGSSVFAKHAAGLFLGSLVLVIGGALDDKFNLKPKKQILFPVIAAIIVIASGISISYITKPFGGIIHLDKYQFILFKYKGAPYKVSLPADIITFFWILGMIYTTKLLDGLDGLVAGVTFIGAMVIFGASLSKFYVIPQIALLSIILAGACLGFLIFNFNPAKIFLGEGGSTLCGFLLASLAVLSQGKVAITLLIMGIPILDIMWVILRRIFSRKKILHGDRHHLHHRLLDAGFSQKETVIFFYIFTGSFGLISLFLRSQGRLIALGILSIFMFILGIILVKRHQGITTK